jgi:hypothetical protein
VHELAVEFILYHEASPENCDNLRAWSHHPRGSYRR